MEPTGRSAKQLLPHAEEPQWTKEAKNTLKNRFALRANLFSLFQFSKTPNCFTNFRLPFSKGAPLFVEIARSTFLEQQHFRTCPLKPHAGKRFRNREFLSSRPDWEREFSDLLRHGACAGKLRKRYPQIRVSFAKATNVAFRLAALLQTSHLFQQPRLTSFFHEGLLCMGVRLTPDLADCHPPPAHLPARLHLSRSPSLSLSLCPCLSLCLSLSLRLCLCTPALASWVQASPDHLQTKGRLLLPRASPNRASGHNKQRTKKHSTQHALHGSRLLWLVGGVFV